MKHKIAIRCITDESKGYGHFSRCLILAEALRKKRHYVVFIINQNHSVIKQLKKKKFPYVLIPRFITHDQESKFIVNTMDSKHYDVVIIDMREYSQQITKQLYGKSFKVLLIDDVWCKEAYADIIFNGNMLTQFHNYKIINRKSKIFSGTKYFIMNEEFSKHRKNLTDIYEKRIYHVIVSMGGSDPNNLTSFVLNSLSNLQNIQITIIIGPLYNKKIKLKPQIKNNTKMIHSPKQIWKEFSKADVILSNAGSTLFELETMKMPTICISTVKHQIKYAKMFTSKGFCVNLGFWKNVTSHKIDKTLIKILNNKNIRKKMCKSGAKIVDGKGLSRVTNIIEKIILTKT